MFSKISLAALFCFSPIVMGESATAAQGCRQCGAVATDYRAPHGHSHASLRHNGQQTRHYAAPQAACGGAASCGAHRPAASCGGYPQAAGYSGSTYSGSSYGMSRYSGSSYGMSRGYSSYRSPSAGYLGSYGGAYGTGAAYGTSRGGNPFTGARLDLSIDRRSYGY